MKGWAFLTLKEPIKNRLILEKRWSVCMWDCSFTCPHLKKKIIDQTSLLKIFLVPRKLFSKNVEIYLQSAPFITIWHS
jgi:hypothetical protein